MNPPGKVYQEIINSAKKHGEDSEPGHEVGDLQDSLSCALLLMTPYQLKLLHSQLKEKELI